MTAQPQRVALFGATGKIGRHILDQLLGDGHHVTAYVRNAAKLDLSHPKLTVIQGELSDAAAVASAISGADAMISALADPQAQSHRHSHRRRHPQHPRRHARRRRPPLHRSRHPRHVRLTGPAHPQGKAPPAQPRMAMPNALVEIDRMANAITASGLDWTIARITNSTEKPAKGTARAGSSAGTRSAWP
jgi:hypothetical protein